MCEALPLVSVLIAANSTKYLSKAIRSVDVQDYPKIQMVLILNGNKADFASFVADLKFTRKILVRYTEIPGLANCLNLGLNACEGQYVARLDADDYWEPNHLGSNLEYLRTYGLDVCGSGFRVIDTEGNEISRMDTAKSNKSVRRTLYYRNCLAHPSVIFSKNTIVSAGGYRGFRFSQDWELWLRLRRNPEIKFGSSGNVTLNYVINSAQSKGKIESYWDGFCCLLRYIEMSPHSIAGITLRFWYVFFLQLRNKVAK